MDDVDHNALAHGAEQVYCYLPVSGTFVLELWICPSFRSLAETGSKPSPDLATKLLSFSPLIAQKTLLVDLDGLQVSTWVAPIVQPVLNQLQVVAHTATVDPHPVDAFNPITLQPILFQG